METSKKGLFALQMTSLVPQAQLPERVGMYDPAEQVWKDEGIVLACLDSPCDTDVDCIGCGSCFTWPFGPPVICI